MEKSTKKKIEYAFYHYKQFMAQGVISTVAWAEDNMAVDYSKVVVKSSSTGKKEERMCAEIDKGIAAYRWSLVVEKVLDFYKWDCKEKLIRLKYFEQRSKYYVCEKVGISERTFRYWRDEILLKAQQWAEEYRLIGE